MYTNMTAAALPALMATDDQRDRMVALRVLVKDWAQSPDGRERMIAEPPRRHRWHHRFTARRRDLPRIAAVVHALCDRDGVEVPAWVHQHRCPQAGRHRRLDIDGRRLRAAAASRGPAGLQLSQCLLRPLHHRRPPSPRIQADLTRYGSHAQRSPAAPIHVELRCPLPVGGSSRERRARRARSGGLGFEGCPTRGGRRWRCRRDLGGLGPCWSLRRRSLRGRL